MPSSVPERRFADIIHSIDAIRAYVEEAGGIALALREKPVFRDAIERRLLIISEAAVKLGALAQDMAPEIQWSEIRGLGNFLRHEYDDLSDDILGDILHADLPPLRDACALALTRFGTE